LRASGHILVQLTIKLLRQRIQLIAGPAERIGVIAEHAPRRTLDAFAKL
jgi:hypothetical protein